MTPQNQEALQAIRVRCDDEGECWIWRDATTRDGYPIYRPSGGKCTLVRRAVFVLAGGELKPRQPLVSSCGDRCCCNHEHLKTSTLSKIAKKAAKGGAWASQTRRAAISAAQRKHSKITAEIAAEVRASSEASRALAARFGVDKSLIARIRSGRAWRDYSSPFAGLMR